MQDYCIKRSGYILSASIVLTLTYLEAGATQITHVRVNVTHQFLQWYNMFKQMQYNIHISSTSSMLYDIVIFFATFSPLFTLRILFPMLFSNLSPSRHSTAGESSETGSSQSKYYTKICMLSHKHFTCTWLDLANSLMVLRYITVKNQSHNAHQQPTYAWC